MDEQKLFTEISEKLRWHYNKFGDEEGTLSQKWEQWLKEYKIFKDDAKINRTPWCEKCTGFHYPGEECY